MKTTGENGRARRNGGRFSAAVLSVAAAAALVLALQAGDEARGAENAPAAAVARARAVVQSRRAGAGWERPLGVFDGHGDLGLVERAGSATYNPQKQEYVIEGAGLNMWYSTDEGHFLWKHLRGDFILSATIEFLGPGATGRRKIGWMVRSSLDTDSPHVSAVVTGDGATAIQYRKAAGLETSEDQIGVNGPNEIQIERRGRTYIMSVAHQGENYIRKPIEGLALGDEVYCGLFICAHNATNLEKARFTNVRITVPAPEGFAPEREDIASRLEIVDVATRNRTVVEESAKTLQAPNWTKDGRSLIYNSGGRLYRFDLETGSATMIDTGFAQAVTSGHALSRDGKRLGFSQIVTGAAGTSIIYTVPVGGGKPERVTPRGPSFLHGWSPDGRQMVYAGKRKGNTDIYRIPARGIKETRLTKSKAVDDGPEYTPDGRTIFFNSDRSGTMKIWRMRPDGKGQRQVTTDGLQDWFPHVSPDGRWIVFLSFERDVAPADLAFGRQVYIRMMPVEGGEIRVLAYVYGGRGTIDAPSWSPDGRKVAFVSYTGSIRS